MCSSPPHLCGAERARLGAVTKPSVARRTDDVQVWRYDAPNALLHGACTRAAEERAAFLGFRQHAPNLVIHAHVAHVLPRRILVSLAVLQRRRTPAGLDHRLRPPNALGAYCHRPAILCVSTQVSLVRRDIRGALVLLYYCLRLVVTHGSATDGGRCLVNLLPAPERSKPSVRRCVPPVFIAIEDRHHTLTGYGRAANASRALLRHLPARTRKAARSVGPIEEPPRCVRAVVAASVRRAIWS